MPSFLDKVTNFFTGRLVHVPDSEVQNYVDTLNQLRNPSSDPAIRPLTIVDWRFFEKTEILGATHHLIKQATPHASTSPLPGLIENQIDNSVLK